MFGRGTLQTVFSGFAVEQGKQSRDRLCYTQLKAGRACGCLYDGWIGSRFILAVTLELWRCNFAQLFGGCISLHRFLWGQEKHGHAANTQGACSQICCGESPRALGQKVPLGDRKTLALEPSAKHKWSCGSGVLVLCSSKVMPWAFARTPTERGSLFPCPLPTDVWQRHTSNRVFWIRSWARQTIKRQTVLYTIESRTRLWLLVWWLDW